MNKEQVIQKIKDSEWIPVSKRLPSVDQECRIITRDYCFPARYEKIVSGKNVDPENVDPVFYTFEGFKYGPNEVLFWKPLKD